MSKYNLPFDYTINHIPVTTSNNRRPGRKLTSFEYITIHSTANEKSSAKNERQWLTNSSNQVTASWHIVVDDKEAIEAIPLDEIAWHAGDGGTGTGNTRSIGIELCESGDRSQTLENASMLVAELLRITGLPINRVKQHHDWSGKNCPRILRTGTLWQDFIANITNKLQATNQAEVDTSSLPLQPGNSQQPMSDRQADYQTQAGLEAIKYLSDHHLLNNPEIWKEQLRQPIEGWLFFVLLQRLHQQGSSGKQES